VRLNFDFAVRVNQVIILADCISGAAIVYFDCRRWLIALVEHNTGMGYGVGRLAVKEGSGE